LIAVDTNILVRLIVADDDAQLGAVKELLASNTIVVPHIAIVEAEWVLRSTYCWSRRKVADALAAVLHLHSVTIDVKDHVIWALERHRAGADLADMLLLVAARDAAGFATFDRKLKRQAGTKAPVPIMRLSA